ncbi:MAG: hypothetical protein HC802_17080 [Caldilineaceae bacterium]|nr:hypothetical protein [Caldilineaceae bacterium]
MLPTYTCHPPAFPVDPVAMGVDDAIYGRVVVAAERTQSLIFIRKTSEGSVLPFSARTAVGKKLPTKGKSSNAYFTRGNIPFFASLSKKVVDWQYEQHTLIGVTTALKTNQPEDEDEPRVYRYAYIPKLIAVGDARIAERDGARPKGVTVVGGNDLLVVVDADDFGGRRTSATYYLRYTQFSTVNQRHNSQIARPSFVTDDDAPCYQVFIARKSIYTQQAFEAIKAAIAKARTVQPTPTWLNEGLRNLALEGLPYQPKTSPTGRDFSSQEFRLLSGDNAAFVWEHYWHVQEAADNGASPLVQFAEPTELVGATFYPVNVLALLTKGKPNASTPSQTDNPPAEKKYYEVVADYDVFMIAPHLALLRTDW